MAGRRRGAGCRPWPAPAHAGQRSRTREQPAHAHGLTRPGAAGGVEHVHRVRAGARQPPAPPRRAGPGAAGAARTSDCGEHRRSRAARRSSKPCRSSSSATSLVGQLGEPALAGVPPVPAGAAASWRLPWFSTTSRPGVVGGQRLGGERERPVADASSTLSSSRKMVTMRRDRRRRPASAPAPSGGDLVAVGVGADLGGLGHHRRPTCRSRARRGPGRAAVRMARPVPQAKSCCTGAGRGTPA